MKKNHLLLYFALSFFSLPTFSQIQSNLQNHILFSSYLEEYRGISVSTPANYQNTGKSYPVLYVLDGEWVFDFAVGCVDFLSNDHLGKIPQLIIVGIPNTDRNKDLGLNRGSDISSNAFLRFIETELIPFINKNYRSNGSNLLYGWASGAGICRRMMHERPELFDAFLESASEMDKNTLAFASHKWPIQSYKNKYHYISSEASNQHKVSGLKKYAHLLDSLNPAGFKWEVEIKEDLRRLDLLSVGLAEGLNFVFKDYTIPDSIALLGLTGIISYFKQINQFYNFEVEIPEGILQTSVSLLLQANKHTEAKETLMYGLELHPNSPKLAGRLASLYQSQEDYTTASKYYKLAAEKSRHNRMLYMKYKTLYEGSVQVID